MATPESPSLKPSTPSEQDNAPTSTLPSRFPNAVATLTRLKSFGSNFVKNRRPAPVVFPPPSWELEDVGSAGSGRTATPTIPESEYTNPIEPPEPISFAARLKTMIEALPGYRSTAPAPVGSDTVQNAEETIRDQSPVPSDMDKDLVKMLSSEEVMNGSSSKDDKSIWNILAGMNKGDRESSGTPSIVEDEDDGLMMYAPLEPKSDSQLELAQSEVTAEDPTKPSSTAPVEEQPQRPKEAEKRIWVPSTTELSVLTTWWGYRLYLPPAVMARLNNKSLKATARAAILTTALKWLLGKVPMAIVPPQFRPVLKLLKTLTPLTGYIGVFIAWSWDRIKSLDEGNGVVLSATWLLPVALLPMTWDAGTIYRPIAAPTPEELKAIEEAAAKAAEEERKKSQGQQDQPDQKKRSFFRW